MYDDGSVARFDYHHSMLTDGNRTRAFLRAILEVVRPGDVVLDIGTGTGVLALFAVAAGARQVYAVEEGPIGEIAREVVAANHMTDRIEFVSGRSTTIDLPEPADVLVTETIGNMGFEEGILSWALDARSRLLRPEARIIPRAVELVAVPVSNRHDHQDISRWDAPLLTFDFSPLARLATDALLWTELSPTSLLAQPQTVARADLTTSGDSDVAGSVQVVAMHPGWMHGIGCWFRAELTRGRLLTNAPPNALPSWSHGFLPLHDPVEIQRGDAITIDLQSREAGAHWSWIVDVGRNGRSASHATGSTG